MQIRGQSLELDNHAAYLRPQWIVQWEPAPPHPFEDSPPSVRADWQLVSMLRIAAVSNRWIAPYAVRRGVFLEI
jgi:hypothetical protein